MIFQFSLKSGDESLMKKHVDFQKKIEHSHWIHLQSAWKMQSWSIIRCNLWFLDDGKIVSFLEFLRFIGLDFANNFILFLQLIFFDKYFGYFDLTHDWYNFLMINSHRSIWIIKNRSLSLIDIYFSFWMVAFFPLYILLFFWVIGTTRSSNCSHINFSFCKCVTQNEHNI